MTSFEKSYLSECRLDLWLWAARFYKTRNLAASKIKKGLVRLSGKTITKPASILNKGSQLVIENDLVIQIILVEEIAVKRFKTYEKNINPIIEFYEQTNLLKTVNGETTISEINNEISGLIGGIKG